MPGSLQPHGLYPARLLCPAMSYPISNILSYQQYWSGLPLPLPGVLPDPGIEPKSPAWNADVFTLRATRENEKVKVIQSCQTFCDPMNIQFMDFSRLEYWNGWFHCLVVSHALQPHGL